MFNKIRWNIFKLSFLSTNLAALIQDRLKKITLLICLFLVYSIESLQSAWFLIDSPKNKLDVHKKMHPCSLKHRKNAVNLESVNCRSQGMLFEHISAPVYPLLFEENFNQDEKMREFQVLDPEKQKKIATFLWDSDGSLTVRIEAIQNAVLIENLESYKNLQVQSAASQLILSGKVKVQGNLKLESKGLYWFAEPIFNGTFSLLADFFEFEWFPFPYHSKIVQQSLQIESIKPVRTPTDTPGVLKRLKKEEKVVSEPIALSDLESIYQDLWHVHPRIKIKRYLENHTDAMKYEKLVNWINQQSLQDRGEFGESLAKYMILKKYPSWQLKPSQHGRHFFDAIFLDNSTALQTKKAYIVEVKNTCNAPQLGTRRIQHQDWQQLSTAYNLDVLSEMKHYSELSSLAQWILENPKKVYLWLVQTCLKEHFMNIYPIGSLETSLLN